MLSVVCGKQRSGKSFYVVKEIIIDHLKNTKRHVYTNLPLNPDTISRYISLNMQERYDIMDRIHMFMDTSFFSVRDFERRNPLYYFRCGRYIKGKYKEEKTIIQDELGMSSEQVTKKREIYKEGNIKSSLYLRNFWEHIKPNSIVVFDETYEFLGSMDSLDRSKENIDTRKKLLQMTRQHGHAKLDLYLISHDKNDLDVNVKRGIQYLYQIKNLKYENVFENRAMRGLKWGLLGVQAFEVLGYAYGDKEPSDRWIVNTDKKIFKCYNSHSHIQGMQHLKTSEIAESSDVGYNKRNLKQFLKQFQIYIYLGIGLAVGAYYAYNTIFKMLNISSKDVNMNIGEGNIIAGVAKENNPKTKEIKTNENQAVSKSKEEKPDDKTEKPEYKIVMRSASCLLYSDGFKIQKGGYIKSYKVLEISSDTVLLSAPSGKKFRVSIDGIRK